MISAQLQALWRLFQLISYTEPVPVDEKEEILSNYQGEYDDATPGEGATAFEFLCNYDWKVICWDFNMSENHIGGDDVISFVNSTVEAIEEGYRVHTWYGDEGEVLIIGIKSKPNSIPVDMSANVSKDQWEEAAPIAEETGVLPVYTVPVPIFRGQLQKIIDAINHNDEFEKLTLEGVLSNQPLLKHLCEALVECDLLLGIWDLKIE